MTYKKTVSSTKSKFSFAYFMATFGTFVLLMTTLSGGLALKVTSLTMNVGIMGIVMMLGTFAGIITQPYVGALIDKTKNRLKSLKAALLIGAILAAISIVLLGLSQTETMLIISFCLVQISVNTLQISINGIMLNSVEERERGSAFAVFFTAYGFSYVIAILLVTFVADMALMYAITALVCVISILPLMIVGLPQKVIMTSSQKKNASETSRSIKRLFSMQNSSFWQFFVSKVFIMFGYAIVGSYLIILFQDAFGIKDEGDLRKYNLLANGALFAVMIASSLLMGIFADKTSRHKIVTKVSGIVIATGVLILAVSTFMPFSAALPVIIADFAVLGLAIGAFQSVGTAFGSFSITNKHTELRDFGILSIDNTLPQFLAVTLATPIVVLSNSIVHDKGLAIFYVLAAIVTAVGVSIFNRIRMG